MIFNTPPERFLPKFRVVSGFLQHDGKFLMLLRAAGKPQAGKWGAPAGKIDSGEDEITAMRREIEEETGITVRPDNLQFFRKVFVRYPNHDFEFSMFSLTLSERPIVRLSPEEHDAFAWVSSQESLALNLVEDMDACIELFFAEK